MNELIHVKISSFSELKDLQGLLSSTTSYLHLSDLQAEIPLLQEYLKLENQKLQEMISSLQALIEGNEPSETMITNPNVSSLNHHNNSSQSHPKNSSSSSTNAMNKSSGNPLAKTNPTFKAPPASSSSTLLSSTSSSALLKKNPSSSFTSKRYHHENSKGESNDGGKDAFGDDDEDDDELSQFDSLKKFSINSSESKEEMKSQQLEKKIKGINNNKLENASSPPSSKTGSNSRLTSRFREKLKEAQSELFLVDDL